MMMPIEDTHAPMYRPPFLTVPQGDPLLLLSVSKALFREDWRLLLYFRLLAGMTQQQVAEEVGLGQGTVSMYESGKMVPGESETCARYLACLIQRARPGISSWLSDEQLDYLQDVFSQLAYSPRRLETEH